MDEVCNLSFIIVIFNKYLLNMWTDFFLIQPFSNYFGGRKWGFER